MEEELNDMKIEMMCSECNSLRRVDYISIKDEHMTLYLRCGHNHILRFNEVERCP